MPGHWVSTPSGGEEAPAGLSPRALSYPDCSCSVGMPLEHISAMLLQILLGCFPGRPPMNSGNILRCAEAGVWQGKDLIVSVSSQLRTQ